MLHRRNTSQRKAHLILGAAFAIDTFHEEEISDGLRKNSNAAGVAHFAYFHAVDPLHEFGFEMSALVGSSVHIRHT